MMDYNGASQLLNTHTHTHTFTHTHSHTQYLSQTQTGGNENFLCLWDAAMMDYNGAGPRLVLTEHQAAVKALAWCPFQRWVH